MKYYSMKITNNYQKLLHEFKMIKKKDIVNVNEIEAVVVLSAEEVDIIGENGLRIKEGIELTQKMKSANSIFPKLIFVGTKTHNKIFKEFLIQSHSILDVINLSNRLNASTRSQIKDLSFYLKKSKIKSVVILSHAYHIPRIKRYCSKYIARDVTCFFWPIGNISEQKLQIKSEIEKIIRYSDKGDLPLFVR